MGVSLLFGLKPQLLTFLLLIKIIERLLHIFDAKNKSLSEKTTFN